MQKKKRNNKLNSLHIYVAFTHIMFMNAHEFPNDNNQHYDQHRLAASA